jgi:thiamine kinase-like enzyme
MTITIEQVVSLIPSWQGRRVNVEPMTGGLTNTNFCVEVDGTSYFVRIPGAGTELLAVDRVNEIHNARAAAETGVAPPLLHVLPDDNVMVFAFIDGRTMSIETLRASGMPSRSPIWLRRLHAGPRFHQDFDMFRLIEVHLETAERHAVHVPDDYRDHLGTVARIEQAVRRQTLPAVPCHNDLLAENYIDDGRQLWLIDFEYSGNNDPCFELGNTCQELQYDEARMAELCKPISAGQRPHAGAHAPLRPDVRRGLDVVGSHPGQNLHARLRLLGLRHDPLESGARDTERNPVGDVAGGSLMDQWPVAGGLGPARQRQDGWPRATRYWPLRP